MMQSDINPSLPIEQSAPSERAPCEKGRRVTSSKRVTLPAMVVTCLLLHGSRACSQQTDVPVVHGESYPSESLLIKQPTGRESRTSFFTQRIIQPKAQTNNNALVRDHFTPSGVTARLTTRQTDVINNHSTADEDLLAPAKTQVPKGKQPSSGSSAPPSLYDDVFLLPPPPSREQTLDTPKANQPESEADTENELLLPDSAPRNDAPSPSDKKHFKTKTDEELLDERGVTPYQKPSIDGPSERVVPLPITPAPPNFKGFGPVDPELETQLPEPQRAFPLPKIPKPKQVDPVAPDLIPNRFPNGSEQWTFSEDAMTNLSGSFDSPEFGALLSPLTNHRGRVGNRTIASTHAPMQFAGYPTSQSNLYDPNPVAENRPTLAPFSTLPERVGNRYRQYQFSKELPCSTNPHPAIGNCLQEVPYQSADFAPIPQCPQPRNPCQEIETYYGKSLIETQRPWVEWWRPFYTGGMYDPGIPVFSDSNLLTPSFLVYGDYRTGVGIHRANGKEVRNWAHRLNLDMDLRLTGTERFHMFTGPLDHNGKFTRLDFSDTPVEFEEELDFQLDTAFFEGDLGAITGGFRGTNAPFDLPFTCGLVPLLYQNGVWMEDAILGFAVGSPWRNSKELNWSSYEATFFAGFNQVTSPAFQNDNSAAAVFGSAWFVEAYGGYIEMDYAYLDDLDNLGRSYHNAAIAYTRRYLGRVSNTVRLIGNAGQRGPVADRSADGGLLLFENSLITSQPSTFVPYWNMFLGNGRPQSVARAGNSGGILRNTGINYEGDGLTGYPTLAATGANSYGGAIGINRLGADFGSQFIVEFAALDTYGDPTISGIAGPQYAIGSRYQRAINTRSLWRVDFINGWLDDAPDIYGTRAEFRWKF